MISHQPGIPFDSDADLLPSELQGLLDRKEVNLLDLERLVWEEHRSLLHPEGGELLGLLQDIEEVLGRIGRLEDQRSRLEAKMGVGPGLFSAPSSGAGTAYPSAPGSGRLLESRHRFLGLIARIAEVGEANRLLIEGLARTGKVRLDWLSRLEPSEASVASHSLRLRRRYHSAEAFDVPA